VATEEAIDPIVGGIVVGDESIDLVVIQLVTTATAVADLTIF